MTEPASAGPVPKQDGPVDHRRHGHAAIAAVPAAVAHTVNQAAYKHQDHQQDDQLQDQAKPDSLAGTLGGLGVEEILMDVGEQVGNAGIVPGRLKVLIQVAVQICGLPSGKAIGEPPAGEQVAVAGGGVHQQDGVVLPQLQLFRPGPCGLLQIPGVLLGDHRQDASAQLIPVGVV